MKRTKRIISFLVAFSICVASYCSMGAGNSQVGVTPAEYVQSFMNTTDPDKKLLAGETIEIYDENDELSGFCVSLTKDGGANGYVVIKFYEDEDGAVKPVVSEFCSEQGVENIYQEIVQDERQEITPAAEAAALNRQEKKIYSLGPNEYSVEVTQDGEPVYANYTAPLMTKEEFKEQKKIAKERKKLAKQKQKEQRAAAKAQKKVEKTAVQQAEGPSIVYTAAPPTFDNAGKVLVDKYSGSVNSQNSIPSPNLNYIVQADTETFMNSFACGVVAGLNLLYYYDSHGYPNMFSDLSTMYDVYSDLWNKSNTKVNKINNGIKYGTTINTDLYKAIKSVVESKGYALSYDHYWFDHWFSDYVRDINADKPILVLYNYINAEHKEDGHFVLAVGYVRTSQADYLQVQDTWHRELRYMNFSGFSYESVTGCSFNMLSMPSYK